MFRNSTMKLAFALTVLVSMQFYSAGAVAQPNPVARMCAKGILDATKAVWVAIKPGVTLAAFGTGAAYACKEIVAATNGVPYKINGEVVGYKFGIDVANGKDCPCSKSTSPQQLDSD